MLNCYAVVASKATLLSDWSYQFRGSIPKVVLGLDMSIPSFINILGSKTHDVDALYLLIPEARAIPVMDRNCLDFFQLHILYFTDNFFVIRVKSNMDNHFVYWQPWTHTVAFFSTRPFRSVVSIPDMNVSSICGASASRPSLASRWFS